MTNSLNANPSVLAFRNGKLILPNSSVEDAVLIARNGVIEYAGAAKSHLPKNAIVVDARGGMIAPGFVDIHVHGGDGADFMDGTVEAVRTAIRCHAKHGTTSLFPTTTTGSPAQIEAMLQATAIAKTQWTPEHGARIAGVHLYGPFFALDKMGCHRPDGRRDPTRTEYSRYFDTKMVSIATCAAELSGADAFYKAARKHGCFITCGHSNANWTEMDRAFRNGMRHVDHFWCAMSSVVSLRTRFGTPMQASMEQFVLANTEMSTEVIADGCHLSDELLNFAFRMKGASHLCLVTDSSRALDMPPGRYAFGDIRDEKWFLNDGEVGRTMDGKGLASSTAGMDRMVRVMVRATKAPLHEIFRMASLTPAERVGIESACGSLEPGKRADVLLLNKTLHPRRVFIGGVEVI